MSKIYIYKKKDLSTDKMQYYQAVSKTKLKEAGFDIPEGEEETLYLDSECFKIFMNAQTEVERMIHEDTIDPRTGFVKGSQEYNDYYYPIITEKSERRR